jgi:hypothetical protein
MADALSLSDLSTSAPSRVSMPELIHQPKENTMRKVTKTVCGAFLRGENRKVGNTQSEGGCLFLHGNLIATNNGGLVTINDAGWRTVTTKDRLNGVLELAGVPHRIFQKDFCWFIWNYETKEERLWLGHFSFYWGELKEAA